MQQLQRRKTSPQVHKSHSITSTCMLSKATPADLVEISKVHRKIKTTSDKLHLLERKYKIRSFAASLNLDNYPKHVRSTVAKLWHYFHQGASDLDFLFVDEDYYC
jgi:hypothetical protein